MTQLVNNFRAGWIRVLVGLFGLGVVPWVLPQTEPLRWLFVAYVAAALLVQVLIKRDIGGDNRALVMGLVDLGVLTFFIHLVGSASTILVSVYFVIGTITACCWGHALEHEHRFMFEHIIQDTEIIFWH